MQVVGSTVSIKKQTKNVHTMYGTVQNCWYSTSMLSKVSFMYACTVLYTSEPDNLNIW